MKKRRRTTDRKIGIKTKSSKSGMKKFNGTKIRRILSMFFFIAFVAYIGYSTHNILSVKVVDYTKLNSSSNYLLSKKEGDLEKTLIIFEDGKDNNRKISNVYLFLRNEKKNRSLLVYIPSSMYFDGLEEDFGNKIPISSLRYAGDFLQEGRGIEYSLWQFNQLLGVKYQNYIWFTSESMDVLNDVYGDMNDVSDNLKSIYRKEDDVELTDDFMKLNSLSSKFSVVKMIVNSNKITEASEKIYSNLSFLELMNRVKSFNSVLKSSEAYLLNLFSSKYITEELASSGGQIGILNSTAYDESFRDLYSKILDSNLEKERVRVEVYNGSDISGAAYQFGRQIVNSGCEVVRYGNAPSIIEKTVVYVPNLEEFATSFSVVSEIFSGRFELVEGRPSFMTTGDIVIILGEDIKGMYSF